MTLLALISLVAVALAAALSVLDNGRPESSTRLKLAITVLSLLLLTLLVISLQVDLSTTITSKDS